MTRIQDAERQEAIDSLRNTLKPGDVVYCVLRSVSRSGLSRVIDLQRIMTDEDGDTRIVSIGYRTARALEMAWDRDRDGIKVSGCGMDMGFHLVYELGRVLYPDGTGRSPDGGYALTHHWV